MTEPAPAERRDLIAVGASAGGVEALRALVGGLPPAYPGTLLVVLHMPRSAPSALPGILSRSGPLPATAARDGEPVAAGRIYVAPADHHLLLMDGHLQLSRGPTENGHRPAVDPLFRSVARAAGRRAVGVVLSGSRDDGAAGLAVIAARGGATIVQEPQDALHPWMPRAALNAVEVHHVVPAAKIGPLLGEITATTLAPASALGPDPLLDAEVAVSEFVPLSSDQFAPPAGFGCPTCGGSLFQIEERPIPRFRCRVGHAWSPETLLDEQAEVLEGALWMALRALREKAELSRRMAAGGRDHFLERAEEAEAAAATLGELIARLGATATN
ncbi:chemotaxis protein CheB [Actinoplanes italicus]|uniref:protein-glutamate methylesterase n=1 Tax=Actinoplanes italicus TaxID=113567 RepID=A0A2T0KCX0_9ACTN|nr:chemotaxis protein CheB [Actinoplanes italicus]PRX21078.1 two-component system chemotaxis response regulator CheB [Actinoplanes italicus]GIE31555.1 chemotaxis protein CheB [Actinoplanes italicus]